MRLTIYSLLMVVTITNLQGQKLNKKLNDLPIASGVYVEGVEEDWLISSEMPKAKVFKTTKGNELILSNGIISRSFRLEPNVITTSLKNLTEQEELIRAVGPEAVINVDGFSIDVGGMKGQPNLAFLYPDWLDNLKSDPLAFKLEDFNIGEPQKRFEWNEVRYHAPDIEWPPKGVHLKMDYVLPDIPFGELMSASSHSETGRQVLYKDYFNKLSPDWQIVSSKTHNRSSFTNEGKVGEIYTPINTVVYAELKLPYGTGLVETDINVGTDRSGAWGPGIALVWEERIIKFNIRPGNESGMKNKNPWKFTVYDGEKVNDRAGGKNNVNLDQTWSLRLRIDNTKVHAEAKAKGEKWKTLESIDFGKKVPDPISVRIGKLGKKAEAKDHESPGELGRSTFDSFAAYSRVDENKLAILKNKLEELKKLKISINYELYDGIPVLSKWVEIENNSESEIKIENIISERLALADHDPYPNNRGHLEIMEQPNIHIETNYAMAGGKCKVANLKSVHWKADQDYITQISYKQLIPNLVMTHPEHGYNVKIKPSESIESIRTFVLPFDSFDKERKGLSMRKMYRIVAPWVTENPLMLHISKSKLEEATNKMDKNKAVGWEDFKLAVDQAAELGYEMVNFSFGSGFNPEDMSKANMAQMVEYSEYARSKNIGIGTYSLLASRNIDDFNNVINPKTGKPGGHAIYGNSPCLGSNFGIEYFDKLQSVFEKTGFLTFTHDGSYPGDVCASTNHPGHNDLGDSQFEQWRKITDFYKWLRSRGVYLRVPDYYYLTGANQSAIGYRENNWSLPRRHQLIHTRQNIFDGTWESTPTMRWCFIPLTEYHGGGEAATIEPLNEHLDHYEMMLVSNMGMGIQSTLRGPRLYDTDETKAMVSRVVNWYKKYRIILESDVIHIRRADGRDIDYMMHANPLHQQKGMLMVFNPTDHVITKKIKIPLYYTGLSEKANIREKEGQSVEYLLDREYEVELTVTIQPNWYNWYVIE